MSEDSSGVSDMASVADPPAVSGLAAAKRLWAVVSPPRRLAARHRRVEAMGPPKVAACPWAASPGARRLPAEREVRVGGLLRVEQSRPAMTRTPQAKKQTMSLEATHKEDRPERYVAAQLDCASRLSLSFSASSDGSGRNVDCRLRRSAKGGQFARLDRLGKGYGATMSKSSTRAPVGATWETTTLRDSIRRWKAGDRGGPV